MATICVWSGYRAAHKSEILLVVFDGERIGAAPRGAEAGRALERVFYWSSDGRIVVHEVWFDVYSTQVGCIHDLGAIRAFSDIGEVRQRYPADWDNIEALISWSEIEMRAEIPNAAVLTLNEFCEFQKFAAEEK